MNFLGFGNRQPTHEKAQQVAREGKSQLRNETRHLERDLRKIQQDEQKLRQQIQIEAKKGNKAAVQALAKQVVQSQKAANRLGQVKGTLSSASTQLTVGAASASMASSMQKSAAIMKEVSSVVDVPELQNTMESMKREMARAEFADEIIEEGFAELDDEGEIDDEICKVFDELELDAAALMAKNGYLTTPAAVVAPVAPTSAPEIDEVVKRLAALH